MGASEFSGPFLAEHVGTLGTNLSHGRAPGHGLCPCLSLCQLQALFHLPVTPKCCLRALGSSESVQRRGRPATAALPLGPAFPRASKPSFDVDSYIILAVFCCVINYWESCFAWSASCTARLL